MKNTLNVTLLLSAVFVLSACSSLKVNSDKDDSVDFTQYKTFEYFGWSQESDKILNSIDKERIEKAFGAELEKRGLKYVEKGTGGDMVVTLYIVTEQKTQTSATTTGMGYGGGYGFGYRGYGPGYGWGGTTSHTTVSQYDYTVGTFIIDVFDEKEKKLIWESIGKGTINEKTKGRAERISKVAARMMLEYPVKPIK